MMGSVTLKSGSLDQRLTLQQRAAGVSVDLGEAAGAWAGVATVWAQAQPLRGREFFASGQMQQALDVRFRIRWRAGVLASMRVLWRGEPYEIVGEPINVDGARVVLELMCVKGVRDGR
jgi:SPP1 family predicted phage head-tail adaptor